MNDTPLPNTVRATTTRGAPEETSPEQRLCELARDRGRPPPASQPKAAHRASSGERSSTRCGVVERLLAVQVDDRDQVRQPVLGREHHRLPHAALVALGIAHEHVDAPARARHPRGQSGAGAERQTLSERAGGEVDAGKLRDRDARRGGCRRRSSVASASSSIQPRARKAAYSASAACPLERMKRSRSGSSGAATRSTCPYSAAMISTTESAEPMWPTLASFEPDRTASRICFASARSDVSGSRSVTADRPRGQTFSCIG